MGEPGVLLNLTFVNVTNCHRDVLKIQPPNKGEVYGNVFVRGGALCEDGTFEHGSTSLGPRPRQGRDVRGGGRVAVRRARGRSTDKARRPRVSVRRHRHRLRVPVAEGALAHAQMQGFAWRLATPLSPGPPASRGASSSGTRGARASRRAARARSRPPSTRRRSPPAATRAARCVAGGRAAPAGDGGESARGRTGTTTRPWRRRRRRSRCSRQRRRARRSTRRRSPLTGCTPARTHCSSRGYPATRTARRARPTRPASTRRVRRTSASPRLASRSTRSLR